MSPSPNPLHTQLCDDFGIEFPIVAFSHCRDVVAAVSRAGGLGVLGAARYTPDELDVELRWLDAHCSGRPYGVDVLLPASAEKPLDEVEREIPESHRAFVRAFEAQHQVPRARPDADRSRARGLIATRDVGRRHLEVSLAHDVSLVAFGLGDPALLVPDLHARGLKVAALVGSVRHARRARDAGVDYVVAQGSDAGGHTGEIGTLALVPQVVDAVRPLPVLAAGGIACGRQIVAVLALGAAGAWIGTLWLTSHETELDPIVVEKLLHATERDLVRSRAFTGKPSRQLRTPWTDAWEQPGAPLPLPYPQQGLLVQDLVTRIYDRRVAPLMSTPAGQGVGMMNASKSCREIVLELVEEALETLDHLAPS